MTPLHYASAIRTGLLMAEKARYEGGFRVAAMLDALGRGDWRSAKGHWLMVELWVSQIDSINRLTLDMCRASRMPIHEPPRTTRYEREEQVFSGGRSPDSDGHGTQRDECKDTTGTARASKDDVSRTVQSPPQLREPGDDPLPQP